MAKILVVEDEINIRETIVDILESYDYEVVEAQNGLIGSIKAVKEKPDLIISDINMPEMDGFEMLEALKGCMEEVLMPPFIFLSAKVERSDMRRGMNLGADDYITKPFSNQELIEAVQVKLEKKRDVETKILSKERAQISSELHDSIQQLLVASYMGFESIKNNISALDSRDQAVFKSAFELLNQANNDLRGYAHNIGRKDLIEDIETKLKNMVERLNGTSDIQWRLDYSTSVKISSFIQTNLFRIIQEASNNILKHSNAEKVDINLYDSNNEIRLKVADDGIGLDVTEKSDGLGMKSMKERAQKLGATFQINSKPDEGTLIEVVLRLEK